MMTDSQQLLATYVETGSEAAFRELLTRSGFESIEQSRRGGLLPFAITVGTATKARVERRQAG